MTADINIKLAQPTIFKDMKKSILKTKEKLQNQEGIERHHAHSANKQSL